MILKILKHCRESFPATVAGTLLGIEAEGVCEVTHSFASPASADDDHVTRMIKALRETNVDNMAVGWYSSTYLGSFYTKDNVEHQAEYQAEVPNSVLLVYDNVPTAQGLLSIKALRLTKSFMEEWRNQGRLGSEAFTRLPPSAVFEELPVKVRGAPRGGSAPWSTPSKPLTSGPSPPPLFSPPTPSPSHPCRRSATRTWCRPSWQT